MGRLRGDPIKPLTAKEIEAVLGVAGDALAEETLQGDRREIAAFERGMDKLRAMLARYRS